MPARKILRENGHRVIEIDRSDHGAAVIGDERFGVHHAGGVLIDLHTRENERFVVVDKGSGAC